MISLTNRTLAPVVLACMLASSLARAQAPDPLASEARQRFQEGVTLHDAKREEEAYGKFSQAYAILKAPAVIFNLARTEELTGRLLDAAAHFKQYLALPDQPKVTAELRRQARDFLTDVRGKLGHLQVTTAAGASLLLDGQPAGTAPPAEAIDVMPGTHQLEARLGAKSKSATVSVAADQVASVSIDLSETPLPPPPPRPVLSAPTPPQPAESPSASAGSTRTWLALGLGALAVGSVATGAGFEVVAGNSTSTAGGLRSQLLSSGPSPCSSGTASSVCQQLQNANQSAQNQHNVAAGFFIAGGVFAAATVVVLLWPHHNDAAQVFFSPTPTGFQLSGDF